MRNPVTIPLTKDKKQNLIIDLERIDTIQDIVEGCNVTYLTNGLFMSVFSEFTATELLEEICSPSKP